MTQVYFQWEREDRTVWRKVKPLITVHTPIQNRIQSPAAADGKHDAYKEEGNNVCIYVNNIKTHILHKETGNSPQNKKR